MRADGLSQLFTRRKSMVNIYGSDIPNLSKFVEDTIEAIDVYGTGIYDDDEDSVEE
jgi:hypothetical protein